MADTSSAASKGLKETLDFSKVAQIHEGSTSSQEARPIVGAPEVLPCVAAVSLKTEGSVENLDKQITATTTTTSESGRDQNIAYDSSSNDPSCDGNDELPVPSTDDHPTVVAVSDAADSLPRMLPQVRECDWEHFVNRYSADEELYCVEVLFSNSRVDIDIDAESERRRAMKETDASDTHKFDSRPVRRLVSDEKWIQQVRIQSKALLNVFTKATGYSWGDKAHTFVRPFQYLVYFHDQFKKELVRLEKVAEDHSDDIHLQTSSISACETQLDEPMLSQSQQIRADDTGTINPRASNLETRHVCFKTKGQKEATPATTNEEQGINELRCYLQFAEERLLPRSRIFSTGSSSTPPQKIRFSELWYLFKPGDFVFVPNKTLRVSVERELQEYGQREARRSTSYSSWRGQNIWRVTSLLSGDVEYYPENAATLDAYYLGFDGTSYGAIARSFHIAQFEGEKDILDLDIYPLRYHPNSERLLGEATKQGRILTEAVAQRYWCYNGWTFVTNPIGEYYGSEPGRTPVYIQGQVIVDFEEFFKTSPEHRHDFAEYQDPRDEQTYCRTRTSECSIQTWSDSKRTRLLRTESDELVLEDDCALQEAYRYINTDPYLRQITRPSNLRMDHDSDLALIPPWAHIYSFEQGSFESVDVCRLTPTDFKNNAFEQLQLPHTDKAIIQAAVHSHLRRQNLDRAISNGSKQQLKGQDFIIGKGRGLLIMLHGAPGVGKTATAEAIAQQISRPLFPVSCSDMNQSRDTSGIERRLDQVFRLAHKWDCVLLMDEADVFLSERNMNNWNNSLVSIFLRKLEYCNGMLFLTTNRIGKLDGAVASRLHLILHYRRLGAPEVLSIFRSNIQRLRDTEEQQQQVSKDPKLLIIEDDILLFATKHCSKYPRMMGAWNGRQIRNAFLVAASLARYEASALGALETGAQPQLCARHFEQVEALNDKFWSQRKALKKMDESRRAFRDEERHDLFEDEEEEIKDRTNTQGAASSPLDVASSIRASHFPQATRYERRPPYEYAEDGYRQGPLYARQMHSPSHQQQPPLQQSSLGHQMSGTSPPQHVVTPRSFVPSTTPFGLTPMPDSFHGNGLQSPRVPQASYRTNEMPSYTFAANPTQQPMGVGPVYGVSRESDVGVIRDPAQPATQETMLYNAQGLGSN